MSDRRREAARRRELFGLEEDLLKAAPLELAQAADLLHRAHDRDDGTMRVAHLPRRDLHLQPFLGARIGQRELGAFPRCRVEAQLRKE